jgi:hypothetical protein
MQVTSVRFHELIKTYRLEDSSRLETHRYCCLGPGDEVLASDRKVAYAKCRNGLAQLTPCYSRADSLVVGENRIPLQIKEIETAEELAGYHQLEEYHYRGTVLHGRRVPLIARSDDPMLPTVLGYIELATAFIMNRPRARVLNDAFRSKADEISWDSWNKAAVRQYTNLVVRIARTVISPEFRGLGLAGLLVRHSAQFSERHWHVGRIKPLFLEITADMLRYVPFVESAGMHYIGETEGNLARVNIDMNYIMKNLDRVRQKEILREESAGIVDLQVSYPTALARIEENHGMSREKILTRIPRMKQRF